MCGVLVFWTLFYKEANSSNPIKGIKVELIRFDSFFFEQMNPTLLAAGLSREIIELDISSITSTNEPYELSDDETELSPSLLPQASALVFLNFLWDFLLTN